MPGVEQRHPAKHLRHLAIAAALTHAAAASAQPITHPDRPGTVYEIVRTVQSQEQSGGSSGSFSDRDTVFERVIGARDGGLELEYDLPPQTPARQRAAQWQFPVRVVKPAQGPPQLLDGQGVERRVDAWLKSSHLPRAACGHWMFTWDAVRIECDPHATLATIAAFDLGPDGLHDGSPYTDPQAAEPTTLHSTPAGPDGAVLVAELTLDPAAVIRAQAQSDIAAAEISRKTMTLDEALQAHAADKVSGTINVMLQLDQAGRLTRRTKLTKVKTISADGTVAENTTAETVERRIAPTPPNRQPARRIAQPPHPER